MPFPGTRDEGSPRSALDNVIRGTCAGALGSLFSNPWDVVKSRIQSMVRIAVAILHVVKKTFVGCVAWIFI